MLAGLFAHITFLVILSQEVAQFLFVQVALRRLPPGQLCSCFQVCNRIHVNRILLVKLLKQIGMFRIF